MLKTPVQEQLSKLKVVFIWLLAMLQLALRPLTWMDSAAQSSVLGSHLCPSMRCLWLSRSSSDWNENMTCEFSVKKSGGKTGRNGNHYLWMKINLTAKKLSFILNKLVSNALTSLLHLLRLPSLAMASFSSWHDAI